MGAVALVMGALQLLFASHAIPRYYAELPKSTVVRGHASHVRGGYSCTLTFADGQSIVLRTGDVPDPERCLPPGTIVEKRAHELAYRINGVRSDWTGMESEITLLALGALWIAFGLFLLLHVRRKMKV